MHLTGRMCKFSPVKASSGSTKRSRSKSSESASLRIASALLRLFSTSATCGANWRHAIRIFQRVCQLRLCVSASPELSSLSSETLPLCCGSPESSANGQSPASCTAFVLCKASDEQQHVIEEPSDVTANARERCWTQQQIDCFGRRTAGSSEHLEWSPRVWAKRLHQSS